MRAADERSAKRITRVVHVAPAKRIEFRYRDEETASMARENRLGFSGSRKCPLLPSHTIHIVYSKWTRLRNFLIATKAVQRKRSVVRFLPFGCIGHFTLLQQLFSPGISRYRLPCGNVAGHTAGAQIKRNRCVQFARAAHFEPDVAAPRLPRLINISS